MRVLRILKWLWVIVPASFAVFWILLATANARVTSAQARVVDLHGHHVGGVVLTQVSEVDTLVRYSLRGLPPGFHGLHVHVNGVCNPKDGFSSGGPHYDRRGRDYPFTGRLPVIFVNSDGTATGSFVVDRFLVQEIVHRSVMIHIFPDNFGNVPVGTGPFDFHPNTTETVPGTLRSGDVGGPIACGVIRATG